MRNACDVNEMHIYMDKAKAVNLMWYYVVIFCGLRMILSENRHGMFLRCFFAECMRWGIIVDESGW